MNGVFYPCCKQWHPSPASHRTGPKGECVIAVLSKPMKDRPSVSPAPPLNADYYIR